MQTKQVDVQAIQSRVEKATEGPWVYRPDKYDDWGLVRGGENRYPVAKATDPEVGNAELDDYRIAKADPYEGNGLFIAHARTDIPDLLSALSDAEGIVREMAEALEDARLTMVINDINRCDFEDIEELLSRPSVEKLLREMK